MKSWIPTILAALSLTSPTIYGSPAKSLTSIEDFNDIRAIINYEPKKLGGKNKRKTTNSDIQEFKNQTIENIPNSERRNIASRVISTPHLNSPMFDREDTARQSTDRVVEKQGRGGEEESSIRETVEREKEHEDYEIEQDEEDSKRGHRDEEEKKTRYQEDDGQLKKHFDRSNYHGQHLDHESREKDAEFEEKGEHRQGHTTNGRHVIHKKDEFEKKTEFFDESNESGEKEEDEEFEGKGESWKGGYEKRKHEELEKNDGGYGKSEKFLQGGRQLEKKGRKWVNEYRKRQENDGMKKSLCAGC